MGSPPCRFDKCLGYNTMHFTTHACTNANPTLGIRNTSSLSSMQPQAAAEMNRAECIGVLLNSRADPAATTATDNPVIAEGMAHFSHTENTFHHRIIRFMPWLQFRYFTRDGSAHRVYVWTTRSVRGAAGERGQRQRQRRPRQNAAAPCSGFRSRCGGRRR